MSQAETLTPASTKAGQLCIWTDTEGEAHAEADFNAWYDREHMQERVAIPGFRCARRFLANDGGARRYLALYVTASLDVFHSDAYRQAFTVQTDWSMRNFARMSNTQRRVGEQRFEAGAGEGGHAAIFVAAPQAVDAQAWRAAAHAAARTPGVHAVRVFVTDAALSAPLATRDGSASAAPQDALVIVEGSSNAAAREAATQLATLAGAQSDAGATDTVRSFDMLWRLAA